MAASFDHKFTAGQTLYLIPPKGFCKFFETEGVAKVKVSHKVRPGTYSQFHYIVTPAEDTLGVPAEAEVEVSAQEDWLYTADSDSVKRLIERNKRREELSEASELVKADVKVGTLLVFKEPTFQTATSKRKIVDFARNGAGVCRVISIGDGNATVSYYIGQSDYGTLTLPLSAFRKWRHGLDVKVSLSYYYVLNFLLRDSDRWREAINGLSERVARAWTRKVLQRVGQRLYMRFNGRVCSAPNATTYLSREYGLAVCSDCGKAIAPVKGSNKVAVCASCVEDKGYVSCRMCGVPVLPQDTVTVLYGAVNPHGDYRQELACPHCGDPSNRVCFAWEDGTLHDRREYESGDARGVLNYSSDVFKHAKAARGKHVAVTLDGDGKLALEDLNPRKIYYGVELETETRLSAPKVIAAFPTVEGKSLVIPKQDGSLNRDLGIELVTLPMTMEAQRVFWRGLDNPAIKGKVLSYNRTGGRCGCHIHISRDPMPLCQIQAIDFLVGHEVNRPLTEHIARRLNTSYCVKHKKRLQELGGTYNGGGHHNAVCISSHYPTLEIRIYKGTAAYSGLLIYLDHAESIVEYSAMVTTERKEKTYKDGEPSPPGMLEYLAWLDGLPVEKYPALRKHLEKLPRKDLPLPETSLEWQAEANSYKETSAFLPSSSDL